MTPPRITPAEQYKIKTEEPVSEIPKNNIYIVYIPLGHNYEIICNDQKGHPIHVLSASLYARTLFSTVARDIRNMANADDRTDDFYIKQGIRTQYIKSKRNKKRYYNIYELVYNFMREDMDRHDPSHNPDQSKYYEWAVDPVELLKTVNDDDMQELIRKWHEGLEQEHGIEYYQDARGRTHKHCDKQIRKLRSRTPTVTCIQYAGEKIIIDNQDPESYKKIAELFNGKTAFKDLMIDIKSKADFYLGEIMGYLCEFARYPGDYIDQDAKSKPLELTDEMINNPGINVIQLLGHYESEAKIGDLEKEDRQIYNRLISSGKSVEFIPTVPNRGLDKFVSEYKKAQVTVYHQASAKKNQASPARSLITDVCIYNDSDNKNKVVYDLVYGALVYG